MCNVATPQEDLVIEDEHLLEELAPLKDALERAVHRMNDAEQLKDHFEEEVQPLIQFDCPTAICGLAESRKPQHVLLHQPYFYSAP